MTFKWDASEYATVSGVQTEVGRVLVEALYIQPNENVLDVGCGTGTLALKVAALCKFVIGIDSSPSMIAEASSLAASQKVENVQFQVMDACEINLQKRFDVVFSNSVLHWIQRAEKAVREMRATLKSHGRVGLQFPLLNDTNPLIFLARKVIEGLALEEYYATWRLPWFVPTKNECVRLLEAAGLENVKVDVSKTFWRFAGVAQAKGFFDAVGLGLYLDPLPLEKRELFEQRFLKELHECARQGHNTFGFERIFAFATAPKTR
jgi:trans-aconitate methyltransferase